MKKCNNLAITGNTFRFNNSKMSHWHNAKYQAFKPGKAEMNSSKVKRVHAMKAYIESILLIVFCS